MGVYPANKELYETPAEARPRTLAMNRACACPGCSSARLYGAFVPLLSRWHSVQILKFEQMRSGLCLIIFFIGKLGPAERKESPPETAIKKRA